MFLDDYMINTSMIMRRLVRTLRVHEPAMPYSIPRAWRLTKGLVLLGIGMVFGFFSLQAHGAAVSYTEDMTDFPNPERGFWGTVSRQYIYIPGTAPMTQAFLDGVEKLLNNTRDAKKKIILRFEYRGSDAPLPAMLAQIEQLRPLLQRHYDVLAFLEAGFIGDFGEWHSSENFKENDSVGRRQVLLKLLDVVPKERMVLIRYNYDKRAIFRSNAPITTAEAFNGSEKSRTGATNDCFVTDTIDAGTYHRPPWEYNALGIEKEKDYLSADNLFVPQAGETCQVGQVSYASCDRALADMKRMRWDIMRTGWYRPVLDQWNKQGCWETMSKSLGYRIVLMNGTFDDDVTDGYLDATLRLKNIGFGKMFNARKMEMVLRTNNTEYKIPIPHDPRFWSPGQEQTVVLKLPIPMNVPLGNYSLHLNLADPAPKLYGIPEYSVRLANQNVWDATKGYNSLMANVKISSHADPNAILMSRASSEKEIGIKVYEGVQNQGWVKISYTQKSSERMKIDIYNLTGFLVKGLVDEFLVSGKYEFTWNMRDPSGRVQPAGIYWVTFTSKGMRETRQVILRDRN